MADDRHYATLGDLAAVTGFARPLFTVGPAGSGAVYTTVQEGADAAALAVQAGTVPRAAVLVMPGTYLQDVVVRCTQIAIIGMGGIGSATVRSITVTNATLASLTTFNGDGLYASLVVDAALTNPPLASVIQNITCSRDAAAGAWVGEARASLRFLGAPVAAGTFLSGGANVSGCILTAASGAAAGTGGLVASQANLVVVDGSNITGGVVLDQCAQADFVNTKIENTGVVKSGYNSAGTIPVTAHVGVSFSDSVVESELELNGDTSSASSLTAYFGTIDVNTTAAGSASNFDDSHCNGALDMAAVGPTVTWDGGEVVLQPTGAGVAGFTQTVRRVACDTVPGTDNARDLGSTALAFAEVHGRSIQAHNDAIDSVKSALTTSALTATGNAFTVTAAAAAVDTGGYSESVIGGAGGVASAVAGGLGGAGRLTAGAGGAGTVALLAGAGGTAAIAGGAAGANGGFGGNDGGAVTLTGGVLSGAGTSGAVQIQPTGSGVTQIGNVASNPAATFLGTGLLTHGGNIRPDVDNMRTAGTTAAAYSEVHARSLQAHDDATNTVKSALTTSALTATGNAFVVSAAAAANDAPGWSETVRGGAGGAAVAAPGGLGGAAVLEGGAGGVGAAAQLAGAGGNVNIAGGAAGGDGGGGGANGGNISIEAGGLSGAGADGSIAIGTAIGSAVNISKAGITTTIAGALAVTETANLNGDVNLGNAATDTVTVTGQIDSNVACVKQVARTVNIATSDANTVGAALTVAAAAGGVTAGAGVAGAGGGITVSSGVGGATSGAGNGGAGGTAALAAGNGGAAGAGAGTAGAGGPASLTAGAGGAGSGTGVAGAGGSITIAAGSAGALGAAGAVAGGSVDIDAGVGSGGGAKGTIKLGGTNVSAIEIGNVVDNPTLQVLSTGLLTHRGSISPNVDNSLALGTTALAYVSAHARLVEAHADNTDTAKASLTATNLTIKGNGFTTGFTAPVADAGASALASTGCAGGASGAGIGQTGGANSVTAGIGGAGSAGFAAGGGGQLNLAAGAAGAAAAGGGAAGGITNIDGGAGTGALAGGAVTIDGGAAPGAGAGGAVAVTGGTSAAGTAGAVNIQSTGTGVTNIANAANNPATNILGTGTVSVGGDIDCAGRVMGRQFVRVPGATPYVILADDQVVTVTTGGVAYVANLPAAAAGNVGEYHTVVKIDAGAGACNVTPQGADQINSNGLGTSYALAAQWNRVTLVVTAANQWVIVST